MRRSKPYMGSGPEVEEPEFYESGDRIEWLQNRILELEGAEAAYHAQARNQEFQITDLTNKLVQVTTAFAAHLSECQGQDEKEPREKGCL